MLQNAHEEIYKNTAIIESINSDIKNDLESFVKKNYGETKVKRGEKEFEFFQCIVATSRYDTSSTTIRLYFVICSKVEKRVRESIEKEVRYIKEDTFQVWVRDRYLNRFILQMDYSIKIEQVFDGKISLRIE